MRVPPWMTASVSPWRSTCAANGRPLHRPSMRVRPNVQSLANSKRRSPSVTTTTPLSCTSTAWCVVAPASPFTTTTYSPSTRKLVAGQLPTRCPRRGSRYLRCTAAASATRNCGSSAERLRRGTPSRNCSAMKPVLKSPATKRGWASKAAWKRDVAADAADDEAVERLAHLHDGVHAVAAVHDQLGDHRVVVHRDLAALVDAGVHAHAVTPPPAARISRGGRCSAGSCAADLRR